MSKVETKFFPLSESIDWSKIVVEKPITSTFTKEGATISNCTSKVYYVDEGKKYKVLIEIAPQEVLGIFESHIMSKPKTLNFLNGYQLTYPLNSFHTIEAPSEEELKTKVILDFIHKTSVIAVDKFCKEENDNEMKHDATQSQKPEKNRIDYISSLPESTRSQYTQASKRKKINTVVKSLYESTKMKDENSGQKVADPSKSKIAYLKFMTSGTGHKMITNTDIYGPNDKCMPIKSFVWINGDGYTKKGIAHPVLLWDRIYFGAHGNSPCGASNKVLIAEMNYTPSEVSTIKIPRCLEPNPSVATIMEESMDEYIGFDDDEINND